MHTASKNNPPYLCLCRPCLACFAASTFRVEKGRRRGDEKRGAFIASTLFRTRKAHHRRQLNVPCHALYMNSVGVGGGGERCGCCQSPPLSSPPRSAPPPSNRSRKACPLILLSPTCPSHSHPALFTHTQPTRTHSTTATAPPDKVCWGFPRGMGGLRGGRGRVE